MDVFEEKSDRAISRDSIYGIGNEIIYAGALSLFRRRYAKDLEGVDIAVSGVPFDLGTMGRSGTRFGPRQIRNESVLVRPYGMATGAAGVSRAA